MKNLTLILTLFLLLWVSSVIAQEERDYETDGTPVVDRLVDGRSLNGIFAYREIVGEDNYACFWIVGDSGLVLRYRGEDGIGYPDVKELRRYLGDPVHDSLLDPSHNLLSVSFAPYDDQKGWIVGFVNGGLDKWKGVIYKTTDGGVNWTLQYPNIEPGEKIPCLKVQAINEDVVWVSCGHGYVLTTTNGGATWLRTNKPGGENHFGWLWGISSPYFNNDYAWVCSDQSGLVADKSYLK
jgi:hypothetical protein